MPTDDQRADDYLALHRWQWIQNLAKQRLFDIHFEVLDHFAKHPDHLARLGWRQYEEFLDAVFRNQGFRTELGTGGNDIARGEVPHQRAIAAETGLHRRYVGRIMQMAFLAPDITEAILEGRQSPDMTLDTLMAVMPADWVGQRKQLLNSYRATG
ncbi:MAG: hypothetical protein M3O31_13595 [Acidobacteriota bacterium]|nr:hypothetical protein [Acidobacteriota bacterium]